MRTGWEERFPLRIRRVLWRTRRAVRRWLRSVALRPGRRAEGEGRREELAIRYLRGEGIEIGALHRPLWLRGQRACPLRRLQEPGGAPEGRPRLWRSACGRSDRRDRRRVGAREVRRRVPRFRGREPRAPADRGSRRCTCELDPSTADGRRAAVEPARARATRPTTVARIERLWSTYCATIARARGSRAREHYREHAPLRRGTPGRAARGARN